MAILPMLGIAPIHSPDQFVAGDAAHDATAHKQTIKKEVTRISKSPLSSLDCNCLREKPFHDLLQNSNVSFVMPKSCLDGYSSSTAPIFHAAFFSFNCRVLRVFRGSRFLNSKFKNSKLVVLLLSWFATNARDLPWRRTRDPYAIWVTSVP